MIQTSRIIRGFKKNISTRGHLIRRSFSDTSIDIDHGKGIWKTYGDLDTYKPGKFQVGTFNKISAKGLEVFQPDLYETLDGVDAKNAHALLLRSHKLQEDEVSYTVRAIARCGAGTNNIPVKRMTELGIPVFNTPGANANAVKELVLCGLFLSSRRVINGINHMRDLGSKGTARERVEKDKSMFGGQEIKGKTLAVIGLGHIGSSTARDASRLGMDIVGYDPGLSIDSALKLPRKITLVDSIITAVAKADYISINIPYIKGTPSEGGTNGVIGQDVIEHFKPNAILLNFARGELVDSSAMKNFLDKGNGRYVSDFPDDDLWDHKNSVILPHLGASTEEAEDAAAAMAAETIRNFLENGTIKNSVNFPEASMGRRPDKSVRFTIVNRNMPGTLATITEIFGSNNMNILQQLNTSRGDIAYNVIDVAADDVDGVMNFKKVQEMMTMAHGVISSRIIFGTPGMGYAKKLEGGEYFV